MHKYLFILCFSFLLSCKSKKEFKFSEPLASVEVVTYPFIKSDIENNRKILDTADLNKTGEILYNNFKEKIVLSPSQLYGLEDILLENEFTEDDHFSTDCYNPRHAIYFFDKQHRLLNYVEVCFECDKFETSQKKFIGIKHVDLVELKKWFKCIGIKKDLDLF